MGRPSGTGQNPKREDAHYLGGWVDKKVAQMFDTDWHEACAKAIKHGKRPPTKIRHLEKVLKKGLGN